MLQQKIKDFAAQHQHEWVAVRRHLHKHPELSFQEFNTAQYIQNYLQKIGVAFSTVTETGVVALIEGGKKSDRCIALRADMDALPITEENDHDFVSQTPGIMHACGHDVHTTCLLAAAKILKHFSHEIDGTVKLIFQPGEEKHPGGASLFIRDGVLQNPQPQGILALHVNPLLPVGKISFREGVVMASADEIYITVRAAGGHAAAPHLTADPVLTASQIVVALQQVISRNKNPFSPSVLSVCAINGGTATNIIPSEVKMMGTFRAMDEAWRFKAHTLIRKIVAEIAEGCGATAETEILVGYPAVENNAALTQSAKELAQQYLGNEWVEETELRMGAEDFGYYAREIPGCFFRLGTRNEKKNIVHNVHTSRFDIDEDALALGAGMMAWLGASINVNQQ